MKIIIQDGEHDVNLTIPTGLIFNKPVAWLGLRAGRKYLKSGNTGVSLDDISEEAVYRLVEELNRIKHRYGSWNLVEVQSADGERVLVTL